MRGLFVRKRVAVLSMMVAITAVTVYMVWPVTGAMAAGKAADHSLIDQTGGDAAVQCRTTNGNPFNVFGTFRAFGGNVTLRVNFQDGDFVDYSLLLDETLSLEQVAGTSAGVDGKIQITKSAGAGSIVGWLSAASAPGSGSLVVCKTT
jgi:hypothetical protein